MAGWRWGRHQDWPGEKDTAEPSLGGSGGQSFDQGHAGCVGSSELPSKRLGEVGKNAVDRRHTMCLGEEDLVVDCLLVCSPRLVLIVI